MSKKYTKPTLYHRGRTGAIWSWNVWADAGKLYTEYGQVDGKKQTSEKTCTVKNEGKTNATTVIQQAERECDALYLYKLERKYSLNPQDAASELFFPMLAHDFNKRGSKIVYPVYCQPKFDGIRMMVSSDENGVYNVSRNGKTYDVPTIMDELKQLYKSMGQSDIILDGEVYIHQCGFQNIMKLIKKIRPESVNLEMWIYDVPSDKPFSERLLQLKQVEAKIAVLGLKHLRVAPTETVISAADAHAAAARYVQDGYEGAIVRLPDGIYEFGHRSPSLLKLKTFLDKEFKIVDIIDGDGRYKGLAIFVCEINGKTFNVNPRGTFEQKAEWYTNKKDYIDKLLIVRYFELTDDGIPRFPIGHGIRLEEDV